MYNSAYETALRRLKGALLKLDKESGSVDERAARKAALAVINHVAERIFVTSRSRPRISSRLRRPARPASPASPVVIISSFIRSGRGRSIRIAVRRGGSVGTLANAKVVARVRIAEKGQVPLS